MLNELVLPHLIKPEDLNHHGTLFAGQMSKWLVEACFIACSKLIGKPEDIVCVKVHGIEFKKPANNGDIVDIRARVAYIGAKSVTVHAGVFVNNAKTPSVSGMATFVTVNKEGKPYEHGFKLPEDYIARNREICEEALKVRV